MSDFKFTCPKCGQHIVCDTSNAGMQIPCPVCQTSLTVPRPPPAAPEPPVAGKLSINKSAYHMAPTPPPPGAANAPAKPTWGTKPAAPPPSRKKFPIVAISVIAGILVVAAVGWFGFGAPYLKQKAEKEKQAQEEADRQAAAAKAQADAEAAKIRRAKSASWTLDLPDAQFPDRQASGRIHGADFVVEAAFFQGGFLTLRQTNGTTCQFQIAIPLKAGERLPGKSIQFASAETGVEPHIVMNWKEEPPKPPGAQAFAKGYLLKLEIGEPANGSIPGKVYLCVPDDAQSYVAGDFDIGRAGPRQPRLGQPGQPGADPRASRKSRQP